MTAQVINFSEAKDKLQKEQEPKRRRIVGIKFNPNKNVVEIVYEGEK